MGFDPEMTEIGKPGGIYLPSTLIASGTQGTETSKYLQESKETSTPLVAASERGRA